MAKLLPGDAEAGGDRMAVVIERDIAPASTIGGMLCDGGGYRTADTASAAVLLIAGPLAVPTSRAQAPQTA